MDYLQDLREPDIGKFDRGGYQNSRRLRWVQRRRNLGSLLFIDLVTVRYCSTALMIRRQAMFLKRQMLFVPSMFWQSAALCVKEALKMRSLKPVILRLKLPKFAF